VATFVCFGFRLGARGRIMAEITAVFESGLSRIFATLLLKFLDRNLLIGLGDNRVSAEHQPPTDAGIDG